MKKPKPKGESIYVDWIPVEVTHSVPPAYVPVMKFHQKGTTTIYTSG